MAFKILVTCALIVASAHANFVFPQNMFPNFEFPPMPQITFPPMPKFEPIKFTTFKIPTIDMDEMMEKSKTDPNTNFQSVKVASSSKVVRGPDGKIIKDGGISVFTNDNGNVQNFKVGNNPPKFNTDSSTKTKKETKDEPKVTKKSPKEPKDVVNDNIVSSFTATGPGGAGAASFASSSGGGAFSSSFSGATAGGFSTSSSSSSSSSSSFSDVNGVKSGSGVATTAYNINGDIGGETVMYTTS